MAEAVPPQESVLGADLHIKGTLTFDKVVHIHGRIEGNVNGAGRLHVAREGKIAGDVEAAEVVLEGDLRGNISASDRIEIKSTGHYEGDLWAAKLAIDAGAFFTGHVTVGADATKERPAQKHGTNRTASAAAGKAAEPQPAR